ncbi:Hypothetical protein Minf_2461 [Methylacidiphilum infernorum V4]|uniref:Uncharacterized protein n=1 Tax=Methylacidiphilum infernorum (isolate V4) TaxID=481448 RepID=B3E138_METI4|nr:Hypothetical protein Minf_2461 [Methylacidiphilum infernorum V4]
MQRVVICPLGAEYGIVALVPCKHRGDKFKRKMHS